MVSCGFDAEVVRRLHESRRGHINHWSYLKPIWDTIRSYEYPEIRVHCEHHDGSPARAESELNGRWNSTAERSTAIGEAAVLAHESLFARFAFVFNVPRYAMGFQFVPEASGDDGLLDVCAFERGSFAHGLWYLANVICGRHPNISSCLMRQTRRVRIESDRPVPYNLDGDPGGFLPVDVEIVPERLTLLASPGWVSRNGGLKSEGEPRS